jgi:hypothetical protein
MTSYERSPLGVQVVERKVTGKVNEQGEHAAELLGTAIHSTTNGHSNARLVVEGQPEGALRCRATSSLSAFNETVAEPFSSLTSLCPSWESLSRLNSACQ